MPAAFVIAEINPEKIFFAILRPFGSSVKFYLLFFYVQKEAFAKKGVLAIGGGYCHKHVVISDLFENLGNLVPVADSGKALFSNQPWRLLDC